MSETDGVDLPDAGSTEPVTPRWVKVSWSIVAVIVQHEGEFRDPSEDQPGRAVDRDSRVGQVAAAVPFETLRSRRCTGDDAAEDVTDRCADVMMTE